MKTLLIATLFLTACATENAAGTHPGDMSAAQHHQACLEHKHLAEAYRHRAETLNGGKGTYTAQVNAEEQEEIARQHGTAAQQVNPNVSDCT